MSMTEIPPSVLLYSTLATFAGTRAISSLPEAMEATSSSAAVTIRKSYWLAEVSEFIRETRPMDVGPFREPTRTAPSELFSAPSEAFSEETSSEAVSSADAEASALSDDSACTDGALPAAGVSAVLLPDAQPVRDTAVMANAMRMGNNFFIIVSILSFCGIEKQ